MIDVYSIDIIVIYIVLSPYAFCETTILSASIILNYHHQLAIVLVFMTPQLTL